jgi:hypothetical protein
MSYCILYFFVANRKNKTSTLFSFLNGIKYKSSLSYSLFISYFSFKALCNILSQLLKSNEYRLFFFTMMLIIFKSMSLYCFTKKKYSITNLPSKFLLCNIIIQQVSILVWTRMHSKILRLKKARPESSPVYNKEKTQSHYLAA